MTNALVGDVYEKIINDVVQASTTDFEESGVSGTTLQELQQEWQAKLSQRGVAQMPWDPKPQPPPVPQQQPPQQTMPPANNGMPQQSYQQYGGQQAHPSNGGQRIKAEPGTEQQYNGLPNGGYAPNPVDTQGGLARAQHLVQQQYGNAASASLNAMQQRGGLALPGQQSKPPQGLQLPAGTPQAAQQQFQQQQQAAMARQQQQLHQQQSQPRIKVEGDGSTQQQNSHNYQQQQQQQQPPHPSYGQTDGADDALDEWRAQLAARRAISTEQTRQADRMMHEYAMRVSDNLENGLMVTLEEQPSHPTNKKRRGVSQKATRAVASSPSSSATAPAIPQLDGPDESDDKLAIKDEDDADAINSDLDDSDEDAGGPMGDDDDDLGDSILCTYDKVQRVKNKWKCTLKDGVMSVGGKEWVFHKGMGEFEW